ncbi:MAG: co-chaperone GroES [Deltaproteobacteria bacterium]|nr:co-chaperone GroES [Deltaproteobacteria bacterium]
MKIKPLHDKVVVKRIAAEEVSKGGIIIPESAKEKPIEALVVAVGPGKRADDGKRIEPMVKKGDMVLFSKWSGNEIKIDDEEHLIMNEDEILAIIEN